MGFGVLKITEWANDDKPREKLLEKGKEALSNAELIGIIIGSGTRSINAVDLAKTILQKADYNLNTLAQFTVDDLKKFKGIGNAKAINIVSAFELSKRKMATEQSQSIKIKGSIDAYQCIKDHLMDLQHEEFWVILLNRSHTLIKKIRISSGGVSGTVADARIILRHAINYLASAIILVHNHPSGNPEPSENDVVLTQKVADAAKLIDINVIDHLIITEQAYYSFSDQALL